MQYKYARRIVRYSNRDQLVCLRKLATVSSQ